MSNLINQPRPLTKAKPTAARERLFFEFTGQPGRMYIEDMHFGMTLAVDGVASIRLTSPVTIYHDGNTGSPLFHSLWGFNTSYGAVEKPRLAECLIKREKVESKPGVTKTVTSTVYKLLRVEVLHAARFAKDGGVHYQFGFEDFDIIDRAYFYQHHG